MTKRAILSLGVGLVVLSFCVALPPKIATAAEAPRSAPAYSTADLWNLGEKAYNANMFNSAAVYLFAYVQRQPPEMATSPAFAKSVRESYEYAWYMVVTRGGGTGHALGDEVIPPKPPLNKRPKTPAGGGAVPNEPLTGKWQANDGGTYSIRQIGDRVWWYGESPDGGHHWSNVFRGRIIQGQRIVGEWVDVPHGRTRNHGNLTLEIRDNNRRMVAVEKKGGFGGSVWKR